MTEYTKSAVSRREFLGRCGSAGLAVGAALAAMPRAGAAPHASGLDLATFAPLTGTQFTFHAGGAPVALRLASAERRPSRSQTRRQRVSVFSLLFEAPPGVSLPAGLYCVSHPSLSRFDLFIAPVDLPGRRRYEAVFTRLA